MISGLILSYYYELQNIVYCISIMLMMHSFAQFMDHLFISRDKMSHKDQCELIKKDSSGEKSKEFGINRDSILNELNYFHVCDGSLLPDIMHDLLEGALQYEIKLLLHKMTENSIVTLQEFNSRLENVELGYMEVENKPTTISVTTYNSDGNSLKQNGKNIYIKYMSSIVFIILYVAIMCLCMQI